MKKKENYIAPAIEIIEVENEGVMAASAGASTGYIGNGGSMFGNTNSRSRSANTHQSASPMQDLEDLINDILTVKK